MTDRIPKAYNGCRCLCHRRPGVKHFMACCGEGFSNRDPFKKHVLRSLNPEDQASTPPIKEPLTTETADGAHGRVIMASVRLGKWMSAALDDPNVCEEMKTDIREWFSAGEPQPGWSTRTALADCGGEPAP